MRLIVAGSRNFTDYPTVAAVLDDLFHWVWFEPYVEVVTGGARGVDALGERWASEEGLRVTTFPADWDNYGPQAGPIRNGAMARYAAEDEGGEGVLVAFPAEDSVGTRNMIDQALQKRLIVHVYPV